MLAQLVQFAPGSSTGMASLIEEWQPTFAVGHAGMEWLYILVLAVGLLGFAVTRSPRSWPRILVFAGTAVIGATALRFVSVFDDPEWRLAFVDPHAVVFVRGEAGAHTVHSEWTGTRPPDAVLFVPRSLPGSLTWEREMGLQLIRRYLLVLTKLGHFEPVERIASAALARAPDDEGLRRLQRHARKRLQGSEPARGKGKR